MPNKPQAVECWQCGHPIGWHHREFAQLRFGCLECSCELSGVEAIRVTVQPIEGGD